VGLELERHRHYTDDDDDHYDSGSNDDTRCDNSESSSRRSGDWSNERTGLRISAGQHHSHLDVSGRLGHIVCPSLHAARTWQDWSLGRACTANSVVACSGSGELNASFQGEGALAKMGSVDKSDRGAALACKHGLASTGDSLPGRAPSVMLLCWLVKRPMNRLEAGKHKSYIRLRMDCSCPVSQVLWK